MSKQEESKVTIKPSNGDFEVLVNGKIHQIVCSHEEALALRNLLTHQLVVQS